MFSKILKILIAYKKTSLFFTLLCCIILSSFAFKLSVDASAESLLLEDDKDLKIFRELSKHYKSDNFLMLSFSPKDQDPFSRSNLEKLASLHTNLEQISGINRILSPLNAPLLKSSDNKDLKDLLKHIPTLKDADINLTKAKWEFTNSPFYQGNIISKDGKTAALIIYLEPDLRYTELISLRDEAKDENEKAHFRLLIKKHQEEQKLITSKLLQEIKTQMKAYEKEDIDLHISGVSLIADDMISYIKDDLLVYGLSLILLLSLALWWFFKAWRFVILPLFVCLISLSSASGIFALFHFPITVISSNYVALMLIICVSVIIHLIAHFVELSHNFPKASIQRLVLATLLAKAKPSFYAILTTAIGFLSLLFSGIEPIIKLGIMMSLGISVSLILSYLFFASILPCLKPRAYALRKFNFSFLSFCANTSLKYKKSIYVICFFAVLLALLGISKLKVENSFVNYFKDSSEIKQGLLVIDKNLGGTLPLDLIIKFKKNETKTHSNDSFEDEFEALSSKETYWFDSRKTRIAKRVHEYLVQKRFIGSVLSLNSLLILGKDINEGRDLDDFALAFLNENLPPHFKQDLLSPFVNIEENELRFSMRIIDSDKNLKRDDFLKELNEELKTLLKDEELDFKLTGIMLLYNNMLQSLFASQFNTLAFVVLVIFSLFVVIFRSFRYASAAILANIIPLSLVFAFMGFLGLPLDLMSITIAAIAIGIGVDDALHYVYRFKEELKKQSLENAIFTTHRSIGSAIYYTTFAIVLGFSVMMSSNFIPTIYFGVLTILVMLLLLLGSLFLLPCFLSTFYKKV
ncbi:hypothetical protein DMB92_02680 [Campylobacter sp. MIT 99-7217]|uniref:efflux RND transporter permease subunit n=1 Tax=Campylobacter sp. MIT 99-7217 TaxID=535091 RepID=UPI001157EF67|nr:MMPL family transporter [Campylobacter sp. MIT 99-7217]TQR33877.1 hypothetical protein DMB92_02680 [Campylobacter sp. MIT 99-7217]